MARTGRELSIAKGAQLAAQRLLGDRDAELLPNPLDEIDQAPAHDTVDGRDRALVDDTLQSLTLLVVEKRTGTWRLPVTRPSGPLMLKRSTQSRTICSVTQPIRAASVREAPS